MTDTGRYLTAAVVSVPLLAGLAVLADCQMRLSCGFCSHNRVARMQMCCLAGAIGRFAADRGRLPQDLSELIERDSQSGGRYLEAERIPYDPWGGWYAYEPRRNSFVISSWGEDQLMATPDDVSRAWSLEPGGDLAGLSLGD